MSKLSCDTCCIVVRLYCSNEDVEYGFNFKLLRDETINLTTLLESLLDATPWNHHWSQVYFSQSIYLSVGLFQKKTNHC